MIQNFSQPTILMADDDAFIRQMLSRALVQEGYHVIPVSNGQECLETYAKTDVNVVLLDGQMPIMDGFTCCAYLQRQPGIENTPVLMITSLDDPLCVDRAFEVGAVDYVTKPIHWPILRQRVKLTIERSQLLKELDHFKQRAA